MNGLKYYAFSAHDTTLEVVFASFGFSTTNYKEQGEPGYAACISFELWQQSTGDYYVKVLYWPAANGTYDITADIHGCTDKCPLRQFVQRSKPYMINGDHKEKCKLPVLSKLRL
ncbi:putative esophageal gland cell secretory protein 21 [Aphelenchoides bicaudatus]|nr:putative esophageal gland cell secretory protein 21 [Aphelenchoides bicaudatus]